MNGTLPLSVIGAMLFLFRPVSYAADTVSVSTEFSTPSHALEADNTFPCIVTFRNNTYFVWCDGSRRPWVTRVHGAIVTTVPLDTLPDYRARNDGHHTFSLGVDSSGYLHITGDMHNYPGSNEDHLPLRYKNQAVMYWISNRPGDVASGFSLAGVGVDKTGTPAIIFNANGGSGPGVYRYWTGSAWSQRIPDPSGMYIRGISHLGPDVRMYACYFQ